MDPVTGAPVKVEQNQLITLKDSTGATRLVLFKADLKFDPQSTQSFVNTDRDGRNKITLVTSVLPLILLLVGLLLLGVGLALILLGRRRTSQVATRASSPRTRAWRRTDEHPAHLTRHVRD